MVVVAVWEGGEEEEAADRVGGRGAGTQSVQYDSSLYICSSS